MNKQLKHIDYKTLCSYPTSILYRMRMCLLYYNILDFQTRFSIYEILEERYYGHKVVY